MLQGKTALVTGSTSGIGLGIAKALAKQGANIVLNGFGDVDGPRAEVLAAGQAAGAGDLHAIRFAGLEFDVNRTEQQRMAQRDQFMSALGRLNSGDPRHREDRRR